MESSRDAVSAWRGIYRPQRWAGASLQLTVGREVRLVRFRHVAACVEVEARGGSGPGSTALAACP